VPERTALVLSPEAPYPVMGGGALRTASILEYLAPRYALDVIVFRQPGEPDPAEAFPRGLARDIRVIDLPHHSKRIHARATRNLVRFLRGSPPLNDRFAGFEREVAEAISGHRYDLAVVEHFWCAPYCDQIAASAARTVLDLHNIESALYASSGAVAPWPASLAFQRFAAAARAMERRTFPRFDRVLTPSEADAARVRAVAPSAAVTVYPNAIPATSQPRVREQNMLVFSGNLEYGPNISAVRFFQGKIWPVLRERWPGLKWLLVGKGAHGVKRAVAGDPRIEIVGPVKDAVEALAAARVAVVPVLAGSGTRVKILEAWAAGRAVVSTSMGAEGLPAGDGEHILIADGVQDFAEAVSRLLESSELRGRIGAAGRALYEEQFCWNRAWEVLERCGF
jgi:glycosyltransferase involved in cell wall biosynthesis